MAYVDTCVQQGSEGFRWGCGQCGAHDMARTSEDGWRGLDVHLREAHDEETWWSGALRAGNWPPPGMVR